MSDDKLLKAATLWHGAGCSVVPASSDGSKRPFGQWKDYQSTPPTLEDVTGWLSSGAYDGIGVICGAVSDNLEMFEIEGRAADLYDQLGMRMIEHGYADLWLRICTGYLERTPSGGYHWLMHVDGSARPNLKLARRPATDAELAVNPLEKVKVLIETRGEGGFTIVAPSGGRTHPTGAAWVWVSGSPKGIARVTADERDALHAIASTFDTMPARVEPDRPESTPRQEGDPLRPGDDYNLRATWHEILEPFGWTHVGHLGNTQTWRRPGKTDVGISATTGRNEADNLYVFSSSADPFETEKPYSKFHAYAELHHAGNFAAAARDLSKQGFGERRQRESHEAPKVDEPAPPVDVGDFWSSRPELAHIQTFARARRCSPWAVLGVVLARIITATPPYIVLPALVGSHASLNLFVALVGPSGGGKGASESAASDAVTVLDVNGDQIEVATVGSGEGIGHLYAHREKGEVIKDRDAVLFTVPEVDNLTALAGRQGATLLPQLRSAWSGEKLGFAYADKAKALPINRHTYRMGLVLGVQPGRAAPLLDDADGGTPQRFLWMPTTDRDAPDVAPDVPAPWIWSLPKPWHADPFGMADLPIPNEVRMAVGLASLRRLRSEGDALDGHAMLARLKTAAALALLAQRQEITMDDWKLSETVMAVSTATRDSVVAYLSSKASQSNQAKGHAEGTRAVLVAETVAEADVKRVARKVTGRLRAGGEMSRSELRVKIAARDRPHFDDAVDRLVEAGTIVVKVTEKGERVALVE